MPPATQAGVGLSLLGAFTVSWLLVACVRALAPRWGLLDVPNERSSHLVPTPRGGGLGFVIATPVIAAIAGRWAGIASPEWTGPMLMGSAIVAATGLADDRWGLPARARLAAYVAAAALFVAGGGFLSEVEWLGHPPAMAGLVVAVLAVVMVTGLTNAYNFMDGIDGIAAVQGVVAAAAMAELAVESGNASMAVYTSALAGGVLGFFIHNWPPARIFMGDVGSAFLGYTFGALALASSTAQGGFVPTLRCLILLAPFVFDASYTLICRILRGERWYEPHRQHLYQRLTRTGWSHLSVTGLYLGADICLAAIVLAHLDLGLGPSGIVLMSAIPLLGILVTVKLVEFRQAATRVGGMGPGRTETS